MGSIFKPKMPPLPPVQPAPPPPSSELSQEEKDAIRRKRKGRSSTILTGPLGVQEDKEAALETLLGKKD